MVDSKSYNMSTSGVLELGMQGHSRSSKVDDFGAIQKRVCDFLLVMHSNVVPILHGFYDMAT